MTDDEILGRILRRFICDADHDTLAMFHVDKRFLTLDGRVDVLDDEIELVMKITRRDSG